MSSIWLIRNKNFEEPLLGITWQKIKMDQRLSSRESLFFSVKWLYQVKTALLANSRVNLFLILYCARFYFWNVHSSGNVHPTCWIITPADQWPALTQSTKSLPSNSWERKPATKASPAPFVSTNFSALVTRYTPPHWYWETTSLGQMCGRPGRKYSNKTKQNCQPMLKTLFSLT